MSRTVMDAVNIETGEKIYFKSHAQATYMSDGQDVESVLNDINEDLKILNVIAVDQYQNNDNPGTATSYITNDEFSTVIENINRLLIEVYGESLIDISSKYLNKN